jgi:hypothetical protein
MRPLLSGRSTVHHLVRALIVSLSALALVTLLLSSPPAPLAGPPPAGSASGA